MAQQTTRNGEQTFQMGGYEPERVVSAEVGRGHKPALPVPESVEAFDHREVPNDNTTTWARSWRPTEEEYPVLQLRYKTTCEKGGWRVVRSVVIRNRGYTINMPNNRPVITVDVRERQVVTTADSATQARDIAIQAMLAASALPAHTPPDVNEIAVASFRDLERGGDGKVSEDDIAELVEQEAG